MVEYPSKESATTQNSSRSKKCQQSRTRGSRYNKTIRFRSLPLWTPKKTPLPLLNTNTTWTNQLSMGTVTILMSMVSSSSWLSLIGKTDPSGPTHASKTRGYSKMYLRCVIWLQGRWTHWIFRSKIAFGSQSWETAKLINRILNSISLQKNKSKSFRQASNPGSLRACCKTISNRVVHEKALLKYTWSQIIISQI